MQTVSQKKKKQGQNTPGNGDGKSHENSVEVL